MRMGTVRARALAWSLMAVICCLFPSTRKIRWRTRWGSRRSASSNAAPIMAGMSSVREADYPLVPREGSGMFLAVGGWGCDVARVRGRRG